MNKMLLFLVIILGCQSNIFSQANSIQISGENLLTEYLKEGKNNYLVYIEKPNGEIVDISIWERTISFSDDKGKEAVVINQNWKNQDSSKTRSIYSRVYKDNLYPLYHYSENGKGVKEAFSFTKQVITGIDSVPENTKKDFHLELKQPTFNWELDLETLQCLPYTKAKIFKINFYHPGGRSTPKFYDYEIIGEKKMDDIDCWLLQIVHSENSNAVFWVNKKTREVMKMVEQWNTIKRYKIKFNE